MSARRSEKLAAARPAMSARSAAVTVTVWAPALMPAPPPWPAAARARGGRRAGTPAAGDVERRPASARARPVAGRRPGCGRDDQDTTAPAHARRPRGQPLGCAGRPRRSSARAVPARRPSAGRSRVPAALHDGQPRVGRRPGRSARGRPSSRAARRAAAARSHRCERAPASARRRRVRRRRAARSAASAPRVEHDQRAGVAVGLQPALDQAGAAGHGRPVDAAGRGPGAVGTQAVEVDGGERLRRAMAVEDVAAAGRGPT